ncbi:MAG: dehydrogenase subunit [Actinomycetia bacterium]|nr:dehydrogenase subunit [Actinomycetes bacterium]
MSSREWLDLVWIVPALPLLGAAVLLLFGKRLGEPLAGWIATALLGLSFVWSIVMFAELRSVPGEERHHVVKLFDWISAGRFHVSFGLLADPLSVTMILFVTGIGTLIHLYSIGYMHGDSRFSRFFAYLNLFAASMLVLVLGASYLVTFLGWEGVGLCSYLLISFWFERESAAKAGKKAFITNRVGDFGFMLAMFLIFERLGTLEYGGISSSGHAVPSAFAGIPGLGSGTVTAIGLLLFLGAMGKSAQIGLHIWLPDAMEGPTPVSALIHAATMVTAGVYLMCRSSAFLLHSGDAATVIGYVGAITALYAATVALVHNDIKKVLAYSTISQLGYMFLAVGVGAYSAAIFHMVTHAFFKALLFLGAGSVMHGMHDEQDMRRMGRLRKYMPVTAATFIIGWLTIAGIFPFAGFWSKDEILAKAWFAHDYALWAIGVVAAVLTAFYMTRQVYLVFFGNARWTDQPPESTPAVPVIAGASDDDAPPPGAAHDEHAEHAHEPISPHESPGLMTLPLVILALLSIFGGLLDLPFTNGGWDFLTRWLEPVLTDGPRITSFGAGLALSTIALVGAVVGIVLGIAMYRKGLPTDGEDPLTARLGPLAKLFGHAWYIDDAVTAAVGGPGRRAAQWLASTVDQGIIDGAVVGVATIVRGGSGGLRRLQTGLVRNYALAIFIGTAALILYIVVRAG